MPRVEPAEILAAARSWLGTPWRHQGRLKGVAVDCGGLILGVGKELGLLDFDTRAYGRIPDGSSSGRCASGISSPSPFRKLLRATSC